MATRRGAPRCGYDSRVCRLSARSNTACGYYLVPSDDIVYVPCLCCSPGPIRVESRRGGQGPDSRRDASRPSNNSNAWPRCHHSSCLPRRATVVGLSCVCNVLTPRYAVDQLDTYFLHARLTDAMVHHTCRHSRSSRPNFSIGRRDTHHLASHPAGPRVQQSSKSAVDPPHPSFGLEGLCGETKNSTLSTSKGLSRFDDSSARASARLSHVTAQPIARCT